jgi:hypothetical protein
MQRVMGWLLLVFIIGCGGTSDDRMKTYPVKGKVTFLDPAKGSIPVDSAKVIFMPAQPGESDRGKDFGSANTDAEGKYELFTYRPGEPDGAPAGKYNVLISWPKGGFGSGERSNAKDQLKERYNNPKSPLLTATVEAKENVIDLEVK